MSSRHCLRGTQRGVALIVSLIFLGVLALLGVTMARNSGMEERMAGNTRDRDLAFQAAEAALKDAEADLPGFLANAFNGGTQGLITYVTAHANDPSYWTAYNWTTASQQATPSLANIEEARPRYVIEKMPDTVIPPVPPSLTPTTVQHFRVTARALGATPETVVILQTEYEYY